MTENKTIRRGGKLRGVVLIMVLTVMFMLIILLLATLTVVSTAQNKYYSKFEENQAYYTARSALDIFSKNILRDGYYDTYSGSAKSYSYIDRTDGSTKTAVMKQGLAMEFEMYKIKAQNDAGIASNFEKDDKIFGETTVNVNDIYYSTDLTNEENIYTLYFPAVGDGSNQYGKFVDPKRDSSGAIVQNSDGEDMQEAKITVRVLERRFNFGGPNSLAFSEMMDSDLLAVSNATSSSPYTYGGVDYDKTQLADAIRAGDRLKDKMRLEITSTVKFMGTERSVVLIIDTAEKPVVNSSNAITTTGSANGSNGLIPIGGVSTMSGHLTPKNHASIVGNAYVSGGDFNIINTCEALFFKDTVHTILGNFNTGNPTVLRYFEPGSVMYLTGDANFTTGQTYGDSGKETNFICNKCVISGNGKDMSYYGNIYCKELDLTGLSNPFGGTFSGDIYANSVRLTAGTDIIFTDVNDEDGNYVRTDVDILGSVNGADLNNHTTVAIGIWTTDPHTGADTFFTYSGTTLDSAYDSYTINTNNLYFDSTKEVKAEYTNTDHYGSLTEEFMKEFTLPATLAGQTTDKVQVPTARNLYSQIYQTAAFVDEGTDTGNNGSLDTTLTAYPNVNSYVNPDYNQSYTLVHSEYWSEELGTMSVPANGPLFADGTINDETKETYYPSDSGNIYWYHNDDYEKDKKIAQYILNDAKADAMENNTAYKAALQSFYGNYIEGWSKAGVTATDLLVYKTTSGGPITKKDMATASGLPTDIGAQYYIDEGGYIKSGDGSYGTKSNPIIIDARTNEIVLQLGAENGTGTNQEQPTSGAKTFQGYFVAVGDKPVKVLLPDGRDYNLGTTADGYGFVVTSYDLWKTSPHSPGSASGFLNLGTHSTSALTEAPNVYVYAGNNVDSINATQHSFIGGYVYAPFSKISHVGGSGHVYSEVRYNDIKLNEASGSAGFFVVGSLICREYESENDVGVAYINPDVSTYTPGDPMFAWNEFQYLRD